MMEQEREDANLSVVETHQANSTNHPAIQPHSNPSRSTSFPSRIAPSPLKIPQNLYDLRAMSEIECFASSFPSQMPVSSPSTITNGHGIQMELQNLDMVGKQQKTSHVDVKSVTTQENDDEKKQLEKVKNINSVFGDDYLILFFERLPCIDRMKVEQVCVRWGKLGKEKSWSRFTILLTGQFPWYIPIKDWNLHEWCKDSWTQKMLMTGHQQISSELASKRYNDLISRCGEYLLELEVDSIIIPSRLVFSLLPAMPHLQHINFRNPYPYMYRNVSNASNNDSLKNIISLGFEKGGEALALSAILSNFFNLDYVRIEQPFHVRHPDILPSTVKYLEIGTDSLPRPLAYMESGVSSLILDPLCPKLEYLRLRNAFVAKSEHVRLPISLKYLDILTMDMNTRPKNLELMNVLALVTNQCKQLQHLRTKYDDPRPVFYPLQRMVKLKSLSLHFHNTIYSVPYLPKLRALKVNKFNLETLHSISSQCPSVEHLAIADFYCGSSEERIGEELVAIANLKKLRSLEINLKLGTAVSLNPMLEAISTKGRLEFLRIDSNCTTIDAVRALFGQCANLRVVYSLSAADKVSRQMAVDDPRILLLHHPTNQNDQTAKMTYCREDNEWAKNHVVEEIMFGKVEKSPCMCRFFKNSHDLGLSLTSND